MRNHLDMKMLPRQLIYDISKEFGVKPIEVLKEWNSFWDVFEAKLVENKKNILTKEPETLYIPYFGALAIRRRTLKYYRNANLKKLQKSIAAIQSNSDNGEQV